MILLFGTFITIAFYFGVKNPTYFIIYYVLASTKFLGFLDPSTFIIAGLEIGYFGLNIIGVVCIFFQKEWYFFHKKVVPLMVLFFLMLLYGLLKPVYDGNSNIFKSLIASKEIWYYSIFFYLFACRKIIDKSFLFNALKILGLYLALIHLIGVFVPQFCPPYYYNGLHVRTYFPTYISIAIFLYSINLKFSEERLL